MVQIFIWVAIALFPSQLLAMNAGHRKTKLDYGYEFNALGSFEEGFIEFLNKKPAGERSVLEIGGGYGRLALKTVGLVENVNYIFTDLSSEQVVEVGSRIKTMDRAKNAHLRTQVFDCTKDEFHYQDNSFDAVIIANVFHFLTPKVIIHVIENVQRILKPNGRFYIMTQTPHFVMHEMKTYVEAQEKEIASRRQERNRRMEQLNSLLKQPLEESQFLDLFKELQELDDILDDIQNDEKELRPLKNNVFYAAAYSEIHRIYLAHNLPFPGYRAKILLQGHNYSRQENFEAYNIMPADHGISLRAEDLNSLVCPFGFILITHKEYNLKNESVDELERGTYLGMVYEKQTTVDENQIAHLKSTAETLLDTLIQFHEGKVVEYCTQFPYVKIGKKCQQKNCFRVGSKICSRCKKQNYCGPTCQVADWSTHKNNCEPNNTSTNK